ncbi:MAG: UDP-N-acetylglucosamine 2-epimerase (non-hydrolyzing) [Proteobacteria bacterium]|nr:UDP-N-acetylglucosamine 2-epimerase (non-hydrolyzing) [Pseudomonadota bacterium]
MKIVTIVGARPQFIKASVVSAAFRSSSDMHECVVHTGQHFDSNMSDVFFDELDMELPDIHLGIHGGGHGEMTGQMLIELEKVLLVEKPDAVLVYGDTNSTLAGALAAVKMHIPVAHVEAGLRSFNMSMPEEINRILTDRVSSILFCPSDKAVQNLRDEGLQLPVERKSTGYSPLIFNVGDVMFDVALRHGAKVNEQGGVLGSLGASHGISARRYCLATIHRAENTDNPERLKNIFDALLEFSQEVPVILPLHPRTRKIIESTSLLSAIRESKSLFLINPVGYLDMVQLEKYAALIATDSGGVQKEAFFYRVPCVTLRDETEWVELVEAGWNRLASPVTRKSVLLALRAGIGSMGQEVKPYGEGDAANRIVEYLTGDGFV